MPKKSGSKIKAFFLVLGKLGRRRELMVAGVAVVLLAGGGYLFGSFHRDSGPAGPSLFLLRHLTAGARRAQTSSESDTGEMPPQPKDVETYIRVYQAMQRDHTLSVDEAARREGISLSRLRKVETKIEHDSLLRARVRDALRNVVVPPSGNQPQPHGATQP